MIYIDLHIYLLNMMIFHSELFNYQKVHISVPSSLGLSSKCCGFRGKMQASDG